MAKRKRGINRATAHRKFTTLQRDPTGKATRKYARSKCRVCSSGARRCGGITCINPDVLALNGFMDRYGTEANGLKTVVQNRKNGPVEILRRDVRSKGNGLVAWIIEEYERYRACGLSPSEVQSQLNHITIMVAVDNGDVGRWCANKSRPKLIEHLDRDALRKAKRDNKRRQKNRWKAARKIYEAEVEGPKPTEDGKTVGRVQAELLKSLREKGINPLSL